MTSNGHPQSASLLGIDVFPCSPRDYHIGLAERVASNRTCIFVDTNILAFGYQLHELARRELLQWFSSIKSSGRLRVPSWAAAEYFQRVRSQNLKEFTPAFSTTSSLLNSIEQQIALARMAATEEQITQARSRDRHNFFSELEKAASTISSYLSTLKPPKNISQIHAEVLDCFADSVLNSNTTKFAERAASVGPTRFQARIPPGFDDNRKTHNPYGDLIIWLEIIDESTRTCGTFDNFILISNDEKRDWRYAPQRRNENGKDRPNTKPPLKVTDPQLVREFHQIVGSSKNFEIVSLESIVEALSVDDNAPKLRALAVAFQVLHPTDSDESNSLLSDNPPESGQATQEVPEVLKEPPPSDTSAELNPPQAPPALSSFGIQVSEQALADHEFDTSAGDSVVKQMIVALKSRDWYRQNPAADRLAALVGTEHNTSELFVLGRNLYQAAIGNAFGAIKVIQNVPSALRLLSARTANTIAAGIAFEVYFDSHGDVRDSLKAYYLDSVAHFLSRDYYSEARNFIIENLTSKAAGRVILLPTDERSFEVAIEHHTSDDPEDQRLLGPVITDIKINGLSCLARSESPYSAVRLEDIKTKFVSKYGIRPSALIFSMNPPTNEDSFLSWRDDDQIEIPQVVLQHDKVTPAAPP